MNDRWYTFEVFVISYFALRENFNLLGSRQEREE